MFGKALSYSSVLIFSFIAFALGQEFIQESLSQEIINSLSGGHYLMFSPKGCIV